MKIEVYAICYNEEVRIPYFLRHYSQFADITIYDNLSTDQSVNLLKGNADIFFYDTKGKLRDDIFINIKNNCWKDSKADWVIVCDMDEFVYHPDIVGVLEKTNATIYQPLLFNMFSEKLPTTKGQIYDEIKFGVEDKAKMLIFKPSEIKEINYQPGCHEAIPEGNIIFSTKDLKTLHFQYLSRQYTIDRYNHFATRLSDINKANNWSFHYAFSEEKINDFFDEQMKKLIKVI